MRPGWPTRVLSVIAGDAATADTNPRAAAGHMQMIADPLAAAIVKQLPNKYGSLQ